MVGVEGMAEAERVGEHGGGGEQWVRAQNDGDSDPDEDIHAGERGNDADGGEGEVFGESAETDLVGEVREAVWRCEGRVCYC